MKAVKIQIWIHTAITGLFPAILGKGPWPKLGKTVQINSQLGEINDIEHN